MEGARHARRHFFSMIALALVHWSFQVAKLNSSLVRSNLSCCGFEIYRAKSNWDPTRRFSWIGYNIDTCTGLIFASDARIEKLCSGLNDICPSLEFSACVHVKNIASIVGQIISMSASCRNVTQIMTRYLHLITNSRSSWNSLGCVHDQAKQEFYFCRDKLRTLNEMLFWPIPFVPSKVLFTYASPTGPGGFIQGSALVCHKNWSAEESQKSSARRKLAALTLLLKPLTII